MDINRHTLDSRAQQKKEALKALLHVIDSRKNHAPAGFSAELVEAWHQRDIDAELLNKSINAHRVCELKIKDARKVAMESARAVAEGSAARVKELEAAYNEERSTELTAALDRLRALNGVELLELIIEFRKLVVGRIL